MGQTKQHISTPFFIALILMAMSLPLSLFIMSVMQFILLGFWAYEGYGDYADREPIKSRKQNIFKPLRFPFYNIKLKLAGLKSNRLALVIFSLYLMHLVGLVFTNNFNHAIDDLRNKLPILFLTLIIASSKPLNRTQFNGLLMFYIAAVLSGSFLGLNKFINQNFTDIRELSLFIHPARFSLNICFSIFILIYFIYKDEFTHFLIKILFSITIIWLSYFLTLMEAGIGLFILIIIGLYLLIYGILKIKSKVKYVYLIGVLLVASVFIINVDKLIREFHTKPDVNFQALDTMTELGNTYIHDTINYGVEEGKFVGLYICEDELKKAWDSRSNLAFDGLDKNGQELKRTLIRFLTSLNLRKDFSSIKSLSDKQIKSIENGIANTRYLESPGIKTRIHKFLIGYKNYTKHDNPNGNSLVQRFEFWKTSVQIIQNNFWTGVGTGDISSEYSNYYEIQNSKLNIEKRDISHNQYLNFMISYGVFGLIWFLCVLMYPFSIKTVRKDYYYLIFMAIILLSMLSDDTLTSSAGVTFFAFFNALLLFGRKEKASFK